MDCSSLAVCCVCYAKLITGNIENFTCSSAIVDKTVHYQGYEESPYAFAHLHQFAVVVLSRFSREVTMQPLSFHIPERSERLLSSPMAEPFFPKVEQL